MKIIFKIYNAIRSFGNDKGVSMIEYGLLAALIAIAVVATVGTIGTDLDAKFKAVSSELN